MRQSSVVDLFCGVGGMTHGFVKEGFNVVAGIDVDLSCKYAFEKNNRATFLHKDIEKEVTAEEVIKLYPKNSVKILVGCAPCAPFSKYTNRKSEDTKWRLLYSFARLIKEVQPEVISMENVPQLEKHHVFEAFVEALEVEGYTVSWSLVDCTHYGIPQTRKRLVLFASKFGKVEIIKRTHYPSRVKTVRQTIGKLTRIKAGQTSSKDPLHTARALTEINKKRIMNTPSGGSWKDWADELVLKCHKAKTGKSYGSVYGRMKWDAPAPTMTTHCCGLGNGRFGHPSQHRAISLREAALFQTFPKSYNFIDPHASFSNTTLSRHIGNAVPVRLGKVIARSIKRHLEEHHDR